MRIYSLSMLVVLAFGCSSHLTASTLPVGESALPQVVQTQNGGPWVSFPASVLNGLTDASVTAGSDGATWFCEGGAMGRIDMAGAITSYPLLQGNGGACEALHGTPPSITRNPDGNIYAISGTDGIDQITPTGGVTFFKGIPYHTAVSITSGWDRNVWTTTGGGVNRMTTSGVLTYFQTDITPCGPLIRGPDRNLWTYYSYNCANPPSTIELIRYDGTFTDFQVNAIVSGIAAGHDGGVWFGVLGTPPVMGRLDPATGAQTFYGVPKQITPSSMVTGRGNTLFFLDRSQKKGVGVGLATYNIKTHHLYPEAYHNMSPFAQMAMGPDGNLWITDPQNQLIDVYIVDALIATPTSLSLGVGSSATLSASEKLYTKPLQAQTSDPTIATIAAGPSFDSWIVTGKAAGSCFITIADDKGNSTDIPVTVL